MKYLLSVFTLFIFYMASNAQSIQPSGPATFCAGGSVSLNVNPTVGITGYQWIMNGVNISNATSSTYNATNSGNFSVKLSRVLLSDTTIGTVVVTSVPFPAVPVFTFNSNNQCASVPFSFIVISPAPGITYTWDFGDATTGSGTTISHTYNALGNSTSNFVVSVKASVSPGCSTTSANQVITVNQIPDPRLEDVKIFSQFNNCGNNTGSPVYTVTVNNITPNPGSISSYVVNWGDGGGNLNVSNANFPLTHTYANYGVFNLLFTATNTVNMCSSTHAYTVINQLNPAVGIEGPPGGSTQRCDSAGFWFKVKNYSNNSPGTLYFWNFGDGTPIVTWTSPLTVDSIFHLFTKSSCDLPAKEFVVSVTAQNSCDATKAEINNIKIFKKPKSDFKIDPQTGCTNQLITFINTGITAFNGPDCNGFTQYKWDFGDPSSGSQNSANTGNATHVYSTAGVYTITFTSSGVCGSDSIKKTICITAPPLPSFALSNASGCIPFNTIAMNTTNLFNSCEIPKYLWTINYAPAFCGTTSSWSFAPGSSDTSTNPSFKFSNPGTYTLTLSVTNACGTFNISHSIDVKKPPIVTITPPTYPCGPITITPVANVTSCGTNSLTYAWTFAGGVPATSTAANPGPVTFASNGVHIISVDVTNECGTTNATQNIIVTPSPDVVVPSDQVLCGGNVAGAFNFSSTVGTPVYNWVNNNPSIGLPANGTGNIPSFTAINNGTVPLIATITVTPFVNASCTGLPLSFKITVNPRPAAPLATATLIYCLNAIAAPLSATAASGNTLTWYNDSTLTGGSAIAPTPSTSVAGNTLYYVTQTNSFNCTSLPTIINVVVNPAIAGNTIVIDQNICANTIPTPLTASNNVSGGSGSYIYSWQNSIDGGITWINIAGANNSSYSPPALSATTAYRRIINSATCADTSNKITITVQGALTNFAITGDQIICEASTPILLNGQLPIGGGGSYNYAWESSLDKINWTSIGSTGQNYQPPSLLQTTYYRRKVFASQCNAISNVVKITVNPLPNGIINTVNTSICEYDAGIIIFNATVGTAPFNIELKIINPAGAVNNLSQTVNSNGPVNINVIGANNIPGVYHIALIKITDVNGCKDSAGAISSVDIIVKPKPILILSVPPTICNSTSTTLTVSGGGSYQWSPSNSLSSATDSIVIAHPGVTTTYTVIATLNSCISSGNILVTVTPGAAVANAGPHQVLCNAASTILAANNPVNGTGIWSQLYGPVVNIIDSTQSNTAITGLVNGQRYIFQWAITGLPPCPGTVSNDTIDVLSDMVNSIKNDTIICNGQTALLQTQILSGGNTPGLDSLYIYKWEFAPQGQSNWQTINGATQASLTVNPGANTCYRRKVKSNNSCEIISNIICVTVNPSITNNTIGAIQEACINTIPAILSGSAPIGGDNNYFYQWQTSMDSTNWTDVGNNSNYQPALFSSIGLYYFRRNVSSGNCTSISNVVTLTIRPDSKATFSANPSLACSPFNLADAIIVTSLPDRNGTYQWYADGLPIGSNSTGIFPGYTIQNPDDTVIIKLKTTSQYGCKPDSIQHQFITVITAQAKFSKDTSFGCGPLPVSFTNTSSILNNAIQYFWNFGNGITSNLIQPGTVIFNSSPFFNDTVYRITLKAYNGCDTTVWTDSVKIRSNPRARFGVDTTFGCSPFTVQINNTSPGGPNTYYWDFGNGDKDTTNTNGIFNYTYHTGNTVDTFKIRLIAENQCRRDTQTINVRVAPNSIRPLINVSSSQLFGCAPHTVTFNNNTSGATGYTWNFGDNTPTIVTNNNQNSVVHTFTGAGVFTITIDITNGCSDTTVFRQVTVYAKPAASFTTNAAFYCAGDTVRVVNTSSNATNYQWFWRDGSNSSGINPVHVYTQGGNYSIFLQAERTNSSGLVCYDTIVRPVTILAKPVVTVQSNINAINCAPFGLVVSAPGIINENVSWYFYDSTVTPSIIVTTGINAQYSFNKPGTFYVKMIAVNAAGCKDSTIISFTVRGKAVASFEPGNLAVCTRDTTVAYVNTSTYNGTDPINYKWSVDNVLLSANGNFTHRFTVLPAALLPKVFDVSLIVSNTVGCSDTASATLQMNPLAKAQFTISNPNDCVPFKPVIINASAYTSSYTWLLNGVTVSNVANPNIAITQSSTPYVLTLVANNVYGCKPDTMSVSFTSRARPGAAFSLSDTLGCTGILNVATNNTTTNASSYTWNWGDGTPNSFLNHPTHLYTNNGQYLITLVASDGVCTDTTEQLVKVSVKPVVDFAADQILTCDTAKVHFTNLSTNAANYVWSFGDGTTSTAINPTKNYPPNSIPYTVKLVASSNFGCRDSAVKANLILAKVPPAAGFFISPSPLITVPNYTFGFNNLTLNSSNYKYLWSLGDGTFASTRDVTHKYADTGNYLIRLIVLDTVTNCPDTIAKIARVDGFPGYLYVPNAICPGCLQSNLRDFLPKGMGLKNYHLQIFTTWNELIFETIALDNKGAPTESWNGRFKGALVQQDVYVWRIDARFLNGTEWLGMIYPGESKYKKAGTITVVK